jgi:signal transduction histidine kinase
VHDFSNVLQAIDACIRLAQQLVERDPAMALRQLDRAARTIVRGGAVVGRLLCFTRSESQAAEAIAPAPLLEDIAEILRHTLGATIRVRANAPHDLPSLYANRGQFEAALINLANNARDAMPNGGALTLRAEVRRHGAACAPPRLATGDYVCISVVDEGKGISPDVLPRVTEPFFTTKPRGEGTGLGLAMARNFAERSGGALTIASTLGSGTTVSLWLPQAAMVNTIQTATQTNQPSSARNGKHQGGP